MLDLDWKKCVDCDDDMPTARYQAFCVFCERDREHSASVERSSWCIVQEYTKGNYQFVTSTQAPTTLKQSNPKQTRI